MTRAATIRTADLKRIADAAKATGVRFEVEINGMIVRAIPNIPDIHTPPAVDLKPEDFTSLADWQAWRDRERVREAQRHS